MARWHSCNVLQVGAAAQHVWQFDAHSGTFALTREQALRPGEPPPARLVGKTWNSLWQKKLNVAWLPPENVFIRVARFPMSTPDETRAMVELQLEKLSPIPVTQAVWNLQILSSTTSEPRRSEPEAGASTEAAKSGPMQTVAVIIVERKVVEEFLGRLEGEGYQADRLELPLLDQLQASIITAEGAWIYPQSEGGKDTALVAWCYGGVLHNVDLITLPPVAERAAGLKDQLMQMAWAGELEGWLTGPPRWHLVANDAVAAEWMEPLRSGLEQLIEVIPPLPDQELAARTARRAVEADPQVNLLPPEFGVRYRQQFVDRLWLRGLGAALALYALGLIVYFTIVVVMNYQTKAAEAKVADIAPAFTNAVQLKLQYQILKDRQELKYAALDCWEAVAETLPENITLNSMNFSGDSKKITLTGTAPSSDVSSLFEFSEKLRRSTTPPPKSTPLFNLNSADQPNYQIANNVATWTYVLELKRTEAQ